MPPLPIENKKFVITHDFENVSNFEEKFNLSKEEKRFQLEWSLDASKNKEFLSLHLHCYNSSKSSENWSVDTKFTLKITPITGKVFSQEFTFKFDKNQKSGFGSPVFIDWSEMMKDYVVDDSLTVQANVEIIKMIGIDKEKLVIFDESMKQFSDVILIVEGQKFHVSKLHLASKSNFFEEKCSENTTEITLDDVRATDFQNFLELIYGESAAITDESVDGISDLAYQYEAQSAIDKCEKFLIRESEKSLKEKLQIAKKYEMENLKNECLSEINTVEKIRSVLAYDLELMDQSVVRTLFQKLLQLQAS